MRVESSPLRVQHFWFVFFYSVQFRREGISPGPSPLHPRTFIPATPSISRVCAQTLLKGMVPVKGDQRSQTGVVMCSGAGEVQDKTQTASSSHFSSSSSALNELKEGQVKLTTVNHRDTESSQEVTQHTCGQPQEVDKNCFLYYIFNVLNVTFFSINSSTVYVCCHLLIPPPPPLPLFPFLFLHFPLHFSLSFFFYVVPASSIQSRALGFCLFLSSSYLLVS